ncbi:MAG: hypothetical protein NT102_00445 [Caldiserica bacterium]|nr:hypothetical protein [Caldisericota bacterium]
MNPEPRQSSVLRLLACSLGRRDEVPNQELARDLVQTHDKAAAQELADNLWSRDQNVRSDCLKVLYEIGYAAPDLLADHVASFLRLLGDKNNRMVWGAMIALAEVADLRTDEIWLRVDDVLRAVQHGSLITVVWGTRVLARVAASSSERRTALFPALLRTLETCLPRDVPTQAESILCAVDDSVSEQYLAAIDRRAAELSSSQRARLKRVLQRTRPDGGMDRDDES